MTELSIIIPCYNSASTLADTVECFIREFEGYITFQIIIVNDGSTDSSEKIIDEYVNTYPNIFEKINKENGGQATARNLGLEKATRRICYFHR